VRTRGLAGSIPAGSRYPPPHLRSVSGCRAFALGPQRR